MGCTETRGAAPRGCAPAREDGKENAMRKATSRTPAATRGLRTKRIIARNAVYSTTATGQIECAMRTVIVGDVHGCLDELLALVEKCGGLSSARFVLVGDL